MELSTQVLTVAGVIVAGIAGTLVAFFIGMRRNSPLAMKPVIRLSRAVLNPRQMKTAGTPGAFASIVKNRGRTSGREYETPVGIVDFGDDFVISLPYGTSANWMRNVLAAGEATIVHNGDTIAVDAPELVPIETIAEAFTASERRTHSIFGIDHALRLRRVEPVAVSSAAAAPTVLVATRA
jgi:deazaflavin-dependent oxidoreductase (nitroreductase family)